MMISISTKLNTQYDFCIMDEFTVIKKIIKLFKLALKTGRSKDYQSALEVGGLFAKYEIAHNGHDLFNLLRDFKDQGLDLLSKKSIAVSSKNCKYSDSE